MENNDFVTVPILRKFRSEQVIGELKIRADALPSAPNFLFAIGFKPLEPHGFSPGEFPGFEYSGRYELVAVSLTDDEAYLDYLKQIGKA